jgi:hypothetical protein
MVQEKTLTISFNVHCVTLNITRKEDSGMESRDIDVKSAGSIGHLMKLPGENLLNL